MQYHQEILYQLHTTKSQIENDTILQRSSKFGKQTIKLRYICKTLRNTMKENSHSKVYMDLWTYPLTMKVEEIHEQYMNTSFLAKESKRFLYFIRYE